MQSAIEQTRYWMWTRRKLSGSTGRPLLNSLIPSVTAASAPHASREDQAFADDSAAHFGVYEWPPRSYSCSFCRREFRSAQALGGHMNVHRRDRARLKESSSPSSESQSQDQNHHHLNPCTLLGTQYPPQFSTMVYNTSPNPNHGVAPSTLSPTVSVAAFTQESVKEMLFSRFIPSYIIQECPKESMISDQPLSTILELKKLGGENWRVREVGCQGSRDRSENDEETTTRKRRRADSVLPLFMKSDTGKDQLLQSEVVLKLKPNTVEELDLELRLGESPPKVK